MQPVLPLNKCNVLQVNSLKECKFLKYCSVLEVSTGVPILEVFANVSVKFIELTRDFLATV
jgi:hypothetical protein